MGEAPEEVRNCFQQRSRWTKVQSHAEAATSQYRGTLSESAVRPGVPLAWWCGFCWEPTVRQSACKQRLRQLWQGISLHVHSGHANHAVEWENISVLCFAGSLPDHVLASALPAAAAPPEPVHEAPVLQRRLVLCRGRPDHAHLHPHPRAHRLCWHLPHCGLLVGCRCELPPILPIHLHVTSSAVQAGQEPCHVQVRVYTMRICASRVARRGL